jgi:hypothetical protein
METKVTLKTADLAKKKGFDVPVMTYFDGCDMIASQGKNPFDKKNYNLHGGSTFRSAPTQSELQKWLRETHKLFVWVAPMVILANDKESYRYTWVIDNTVDTSICSINDESELGYLTPELAMEQGLINCLEIID